MDTVEKVNPRKWADENLSAPRARAFKNALRELEDKKFSSEFWDAKRDEENLRREFAVKNREKTNAILRNSYQVGEELEKQANALLNRAREIRDEAREEVSQINAGVYETEEYKALQEKSSELWHRDDAIFQPKIDELMDRYLKAQEASK